MYFTALNLFVWIPRERRVRLYMVQLVLLLGISLIPRPSLSFPSLAVWLRNHIASDGKLDEGLGRRLTRYSTDVTRQLTDTHITWQHYILKWVCHTLNNDTTLEVRQLISPHFMRQEPGKITQPHPVIDNSNKQTMGKSTV